MKKVTITDIQLALTPGYIRVSQILFFSIILGASVFFLVIVFMYMKGPGTLAANEDSLESLNRLSMIHAALFAAALMLSGFLYRRLLSQDRIELLMGRVKPDENANYACSYLAVIRTSAIIRVAILEAPVFFGLVTCFIAVTNRHIYQHPCYWVNALSYVIFIAILIKDFPTKEKMIELFKNKLRYLLQY